MSIRCLNKGIISDLNICSSESLYNLLYLSFGIDVKSEVFGVVIENMGNLILL